MRVKITVLKKAFYPELADEFLVEGRSAGACPILEVGDTFIYEGGARMPEGFCTWAWMDLYRVISVLAGGRSSDDAWYKTPGVTVECCSDGVRPVIFKLEQLAEQ